MYSNKLLSFVLIGLSSITVTSFAQNDVMDSSSEMTIRPFVSGIVGGGMAAIGQSQSTQSIYMNYSYQADTSYQFQPLVGAEVGIQFLRPSCPWIIQTALLYNQIFSFTGQGTSEVGYSPNTSTLYNYAYSLHTQELFESTKIGYAVTQYFHPFVEVGLGAALNQSSGFQANILSAPDQQSNLPATYANHSNINFAYQVGIGFDADISEHWLAGISYQFIDAGAATFGNGQVKNGFDNPPINYAFKQSNLQINQITGHVTYLFEGFNN